MRRAVNARQNGPVPYRGRPERAFVVVNGGALLMARRWH
jgi:hypothetical protein